MDGLASLRKRRRLSTRASKVAPRKDTLSLSAPGVAGDSRNGEMPPDSAALRGKGFPLGGGREQAADLTRTARDQKRTRSTLQRERRGRCGFTPMSMRMNFCRLSILLGFCDPHNTKSLARARTGVAELFFPSNPGRAYELV